MSYKMMPYLTGLGNLLVYTGTINTLICGENECFRIG